MEEKRFLAKAIPRTPEGLLLAIPESKSKHAVEAVETRRPPGIPGHGQHFGVGGRLEPVSLPLEFFAQFTMVVQLPIVDDVVAAEAGHWLCRCRARVGDGKPPMDKPDVMASTGRYVQILSVRAPVPDGGRHGLEALAEGCLVYRGGRDHAGNTTHSINVCDSECCWGDVFSTGLLAAALVALQRFFTLVL